MLPLAVVMSSTGSLLLVVGLLGGGLTTTRIKVPKVAGLARAASVVTGLVLLTAATAVTCWVGPRAEESGEASAQPERRRSSASSDPTRHYGRSPGTVPPYELILELRSRASFLDMPEEDLVGTAEYSCRLLESGYTGTEVTALVMTLDVTPGDAEALLERAVSVICPRQIPRASR